ncbi:flagellar basal-body rod protein FlgF [Bdellovibrio bacteriovorus]|uniref:Flagellar biosynthesisprotein n=1 Tax=Bdellovibrio bacteriovorus (strain ATCC 15356 / DSM 50701 / NCIMB 9529 / HD100) TaxID=264462 RepID=Q6MQE1_BDEBA|nr:flagellar basal-body rod protein FlgF [Bdellovibrio bacteriovorus]CAE78506.1 Flagellar biosynthesisprotein [Bdellovibrio bacteriovorus HD100]
MAIKGVYTALSGAMAQSTKLDTIANNLANVNTPAFKRDQQLFQEYLTANEKMPETTQIPRDVAAIESFYNMQGGDKSYVDTKGTFTDFSQGGLKPTGNSLDVAIDGKGFFEIATPGGVKLTRSGNFTLDGSGQLVTKEGYPVLRQGEAGSDPAGRVIRFTGNGAVAIADNGDVYEGTENLGKLSLVNVNNPDSLQKTGSSLYTFKPNIAPDMQNIANPSLKQGFLETSNVNIVQEMTDMISTNRVFESTQKAISAYDQMADKMINVVGKTN